MRVLFLGETILDVYHYGRVLGKPLKEPVLCFEEERLETFKGGVLAASEHAKSFCEVEVFSSVTIRKDRWVDVSHTRKLFEVYSKPERTPCSIPESDFVVVLDYGHGMFDREVVESIKPKYLAVNVQTNSGNYGFNLATKWPSCDYLCVDEAEARLATQNQYGPIEKSLEKLGEISKKVVITLGSKGAIGTGEIKVAAFTDKIVDTMGAGDAFFAVTAVHPNLEMKDLLRLGNAAGALKSQIVGHRTSVTKEALIEYLGT